MAVTSRIGALAGFAFGDAPAVDEGRPARVAAAGRLVDGALPGCALLLQWRLLLLGLDVLKHGAQMLVLGDRRVGDALVLVEDGAGHLADRQVR